MCVIFEVIIAGTVRSIWLDNGTEKKMFVQIQLDILSASVDDQPSASWVMMQLNGKLLINLCMSFYITPSYN